MKTYRTIAGGLGEEVPGEAQAPQRRAAVLLRHIHVYIYIYMYIERERDRERERPEYIYIYIYIHIEREIHMIMHTYSTPSGARQS